MAARAAALWAPSCGLHVPAGVVGPRCRAGRTELGALAGPSCSLAAACVEQCPNLAVAAAQGGQGSGSGCQPSWVLGQSVQGGWDSGQLPGLDAASLLCEEGRTQSLAHPSCSPSLRWGLRCCKAQGAHPAHLHVAASWIGWGFGVLTLCGLVSAWVGQGWGHPSGPTVAWLPSKDRALGPSPSQLWLGLCRAGGTWGRFPNPRSCGVGRAWPAVLAGQSEGPEWLLWAPPQQERRRSQKLHLPVPLSPNKIPAGSCLSSSHFKSSKWVSPLMVWALFHLLLWYWISGPGGPCTRS